MSDSVTLDKAIKFALRIVKLYRYLTDEKKEYVLSKLVLISGTHIAKFVRDALAGEGRQNFGSDMFQAKKRAAETEFWLLIIYKGGYLDEKEYESINEDCLELIRLTTSISNTSRKRDEQPSKVG
ncbi:MAG TPA: four helix bundle protein [Pyrinomonadaceae bacterium]|nr:four helix bundle protein [Pyrinomonadaceae bacterium]